MTDGPIDSSWYFGSDPDVLVREMRKQVAKGKPIIVGSQQGLPIGDIMFAVLRVKRRATREEFVQHWPGKATPGRTRFYFELEFLENVQ